MSDDILLSEDHQYTVDGIVRPSVTYILESMGFTDFSMIPFDQLKRAQLRGKAVHSAIHFLQENDLDWSTIHPTIKPYIDAFCLMREETGWQAQLWEHKVFDPTYDYCGTMDAFGSMSKLGLEEVLSDYKTGVKQSATALQTAAYSSAFGKPSAQRVSIHLKNDGKYSFIWHKDRKDIAAWRTVVSCFHLRKLYGGNGR